MKYFSHLLTSAVLATNLMATDVLAGGDKDRPSRPTPVPTTPNGDQTVDVVSSNLNKNYNDNDATAISGSHSDASAHSNATGVGTAIIKDNSTTNSTSAATLNDNSTTTQNVDLVDNSTTTQTVVDESQTTQTVDSSGQSTNVDSSGQKTEVNDNSVTNFEAAAAGSSAYAAPVIVPQQCMSGWSFGASGAQVSGSGAFSFTKITPAGVDLNGLTLRDYLLIEGDQKHLEGDNPDQQAYLESKMKNRGVATKHLSEGDQERLTCLVAAIQSQEDIQEHEIEKLKMHEDFQLFVMLAKHALKNDGPEATTRVINRANGDVETITEVDEASILEHAAIVMAIAERNPEIMFWLGAFSEMEIDGTESASKLIKKFLKEEVDIDFKGQATQRIQNMFELK